jgi:hypothetical protein
VCRCPLGKKLLNLLLGGEFSSIGLGDRFADLIGLPLLEVKVIIHGFFVTE